MNIPAARDQKSKPAAVAVTTAIVMRVIQRVENGIPVKIAIGGEGITLRDYLQYLRDHPKLENLQAAAVRKFMERAVQAMLAEEKPAASYRWLLEHCHPDLLAQAGDVGSISAATAAAQTADEKFNTLLAQAREYARETNTNTNTGQL